MQRFVEQAVECSLRKGCATAFTSARQGISVRLGMDMGNRLREYVEHTHAFLRVANSNRLGEATVTTVGPGAAEVISDMAICSAKANPTVQDNPVHLAPTLSCDIPHAEPLPVAMDRWAAWLEEGLDAISRSFDCRVMSLLFCYETYEHFLCNSLHASGSFRIVASHVACIAQPHGSVQPFPAFLICHNVLPGDDLVARFTELDYSKCLWYSTASAVEKLQGRVLFTSAASSQLISAFVQAFNGQNILHHNSFLGKEHIGKQLWPETISLCDDPTAPNGKICFPVDAEGVRSAKKYLIRAGVFEDILSDQRTCRLLEFGTPGNAYHIPPTQDVRVSSSNVVFEVGEPYCENLDYDVVIHDLGIQSVYDPKSGRLKGLATGGRQGDANCAPARFVMDLDVNVLLNSLIVIKAPSWKGAIQSPEFICQIEA